MTLVVVCEILEIDIPAMASTGALSPADAAVDVFKDAVHHLSEPLTITFLNSIQGGLLLSAGGVLSSILSTGVNGIGKDNPAIPQLLEGLTFPIGLVLIYLVGAELFTGYPMWLAITGLGKRGKLVQYIRGPGVSWVGNFIGSLIVAGLFSVVSGTLTQEPHRTGMLMQIQEQIVDEHWTMIFLKAIACGWLVTVAMYLGTQQKDGISKALALHLPFFIASAAQFPHTVKFQYLGLLGLFLKDVGGTASMAETSPAATFDFGMYVAKCLLPITLGNTIGGALFTGAYIWFVHLKSRDLSKEVGEPTREENNIRGAYSDEG